MITKFDCGCVVMGVVYLELSSCLSALSCMPVRAISCGWPLCNTTNPKIGLGRGVYRAVFWEHASTPHPRLSSAVQPTQGGNSRGDRAAQKRRKFFPHFNFYRFW